jgi:hypothetical protein
MGKTFERSRSEEEEVAEARRCLPARPRVALPALLVGALLSLLLSTSGAGASGSVTMTARINGTDVATSSQSQPVNLSPDQNARVSIRVTNNGSSRITIDTVRIDGTVIGLTFYSYDTEVALGVGAGNSASIRFNLDTSGLGGQATGLIPGSVALLNSQHDVVVSQSMVTHVHGSLVSVYGLFGLALLILTILAFADVLLAMARHRMSPNRWRRALRFLTPGFGLGLVIVFTLSALAVWVPSPGTWLITVLISAAVFFVLGYLSPTPRGADEDDEDEFDEEDEETVTVPARPATPPTSSTSRETILASGTLPPPPPAP